MSYHGWWFATFHELTIGKHLRAVRECIGLSVAACAACCGVNVSAVLAWEQDSKPFCVAMPLALCAATYAMHFALAKRHIRAQCRTNPTQRSERAYKRRLNANLDFCFQDLAFSRFIMLDSGTSLVAEAANETLGGQTAT